MFRAPQKKTSLHSKLLNKRQRRSTNLISEQKHNNSIDYEPRDSTDRLRHRIGLKGKNPPLIQRLLGGNGSPNENAMIGVKNKLAGRGLASRLISSSRGSRGNFKANELEKNLFPVKKVRI